MKNDKQIERLTLNVDRATLRVKNRESEHREFKLKFENKDLPRYSKTIAAFANRDGGVVFFGVKDRPRELVGESEANIPDDVVIANFLKEYFQPEIRFSSSTFELHGKLVHAVDVRSAVRKPVICRKTKTIKQGQGNPEKEIIREGAIYYRYSASSDEIKYSELRSILDTEQAAFFKSMIDNITLVNQVGQDKAAVIDVDQLKGEDYTASVYLTNDTARNLNWIEEGRFVENAEEGSDAFYVVRNVEIRHGVEIPKPTDFAKTHPLTKTALMRDVKITGNAFEAITWKLGIKDNPVFHIASTHGKNKIHKYTITAKEKILSAFPLDEDRVSRKRRIDDICQEYERALRK